MTTTEYKTRVEIVNKWNVTPHEAAIVMNDGVFALLRYLRDVRKMTMGEMSLYLTTKSANQD